jgi:CheY-like chemotaxis protein
MGITPELLPRVFELFTQAERALDRSQGGLGIGLTLVRALVEMHDGHVTVKSDGPGCGSEFVISLPRIAPPRVAAPQRKPVETITHGKGRRILVIEDQADARRALQRLLQIWGHTVDVAEDGVRGVDAATTNPPEIALVDVGLPGLDGYEVARRLRAAMGKSIRLVALTGYGQPEDRERAFDAGFDMHLVKPVDRDHLAGALNGVNPAAAASIDPAVVAGNSNGDGGGQADHAPSA